jgi:galactofuranosylgalactofuranosylrhamnosyl-N-acetylglucosaminyl-diphospho-decaprenol beta-1,5/1,6-galactofuranosyltransferase
MVRESLNHQIKHLVSLQYSTVELRHQALEDVLAGPHHLHEVLAHKLAEVNEFRTQFTDAQLKADPDSFPPVRRTKPPRKGKGPGSDIPGRLSQLVTAGLAPIRQLRPVREMAKEHPEAELTAMDAKWYRLASYDSAIVSMNDGASAALYKRDPEHYKALLRKTIAIHAQLHREWPRLAAEYRAALADITSPEAWEETFRPWTEIRTESEK